MKITGRANNQKLLKKMVDIILIRFRAIFIVVALSVIIIIASILTPDFLKISNLINISIRISFLFVMAIGMTFIIVGGEIDLSMASVAVLSQVVVAIILRDHGIASLPLAIGMGLIAGIVIGFFNGILVSKLRINSFIVTIATTLVAKSIADLLAKGVVRGLPPIFSKVFGNGFIWIFPILTIVAIFFGAIAHVTLSHTKIGANIRGVGANYNAANYVGIQSDRYVLGLFMFSGFLAGVAGIMIAGRMGVAATGVLGPAVILNIIAGTIIGGATFRGGEGSIIGTLIGIAIFGIIMNVLILLGVEAYFQGVVSGLIMLAVIFMSYARGKNK